MPVVFKMDPGADITLVSDTDFHRINHDGRINLQRSAKRLIGANNLPLHVVGVFNATLVNHDRGKTTQKNLRDEESEQATAGETRHHCAADSLAYE